MAASRTLNFLPEIFQTDTNKKFLSATLDQLISEPSFTRLNGYIGRNFAPGYKSTDTYISEIDSSRQNYQLEPSIVIKNAAGEIEQYSGYSDLINKIQYYGGETTNHDRLFSSESYTYDGLFDFDKFINYSQYYWVPNGLDPVPVTSAIVNSQQTFTITKNTNTNLFDIDSNLSNPRLVVVRGGLYKFKVNQPGSKFWIQTEPSKTGTRIGQPRISSRDVLGVSNNGADVGVVEFRVPLIDVQDNFLAMPLLSSVDYATTTPMNQIVGQRFRDVVNTLGGIDGITLSPGNKTIIFITDGMPTVWKIRMTTAGGSSDIIALDVFQALPENHKVYVRSGNTYAGKEFFNKSVINKLTQIPALTAQLNRLYYQDATNPAAYGIIDIVNNAVDSIDVHDEIIGNSKFTSPNGVQFTNGLMVTFDSTVTPSDYANKTYVVEGVGKSISLVAFANLVCPEPGVLTSQVPFDKVPYGSGAFDEVYRGPVTPDYILCNRASLDLSPWARQNRWFHIDVIEATARYNQTVPTFDQASRAQRPIIEFDASIQLTNSGRIGKPPVDVIDMTLADVFGISNNRTVDFINVGLTYTLNFTPDAGDIIIVTAGNIRVPESEYSIVGNVLTLRSLQMGFDIRVESTRQSSVQNSRSLVVNDIEFKQGQRVLFAADHDPLVRTQAYTVQYSIQNDSTRYSYYDGKGSGQITIEPSDISFVSVGNPAVDDSDPEIPNRYVWEVIGSSDILTATEIRGLDYPAGAAIGVVDSVVSTGNRHYLIYFTASYELTGYQIFDIQLIGSSGSDYVFGGNTKFTTDLKVGGAMYTMDGVYIGTIAHINSDTKLRLEEKSNAILLAQEYQYRDPRIQLIVSKDPEDTYDEFDSIVALSGPWQGISLWYTGTEWVRSQQKTKVNQPPKFDVFDLNDQSFLSSTYTSSKFAGTEIFSYSVGTGNNDSVLGFPLSYRNFNSLADILFNNDFDNDQFTYVRNGKIVSKNVNTGYLRQNTSRLDYTKRNVWSTRDELDKQYQSISATYTGDSTYFEIDVLPAPAINVPNLKVFLNNVLLNSTNYQLVTVGAKKAIHVTKQMIIGDIVNILIYSLEPSTIGFYQVPQNLDYNSKNLPLTTLTLGQLRNHVTVVGQNSIGVSGAVPGNSNLRDIDLKNHGGNILQSAAPTIYASLFLISKQANFINGVDYARREYSKFKNKFLETALTLSGLDYNNPSTAVDVILQTINQAKNPSFPWNASDMVPYGTYTATRYTVVDPMKRQYKINSIFDITQLQTRAILVYSGSHQLVYGKDYYFPLDRPAIIIDDAVDLIAGSIIEIREYNTEGNYIPETPTKLGLYPKFLPAIFNDNTYSNPIQVIQGHDGSLTPIFGDYRDLFLLELETRIYNNIKTNYGKSGFDLRDYIPGRFRETEYTLEEFDAIRARSFMKWAGANRVNFNTNTYYKSGDPFTYNYKSSTDVLFNKPLPGWWRGIYNYFYDTDRPHTHPWEMLGFTEPPSWWVETYGPAPYTAENQSLWKDLSLGIIRKGARAGTYAKYARAELLSIIPVDLHGNLLPPLGSIAKQFNGSRTAESFSIGDQSPAESAWMRSSDYPFALQQIVAVMKPAMYFAMLFDTTVYQKNNYFNQYQILSTGQRLNPTDITIHREVVNGSPVNAAGYINYISDYLIGQGIDGPATIRSLLSNLNVQLCYKTAGFTDKNYLTVLAEQYSPGSINESIIIPDQNYQIYLNKSVPIDRVTYSAVIIEKTDTGYSVTGYDNNSPFFVIIPSDTNGESYNISVQNIGATIYKNYQFVKLSIPYGYEFTSRQQVVDFLVSYQRYLNSQGFIFDEYNQDLAMTQDWVLSAHEFLTWTLQGWNSGSMMIVSPCNNKLNLISSYSVVDEITNEYLGSRILDPNFSVIKNDNLFIVREAENFVIQTTTNQTIAYAELDLVQHEHILVFDNATIFNDVIYSPELGSRQYRLKLVGEKTANWDGSLYAPGFIYNSSKIALWKASTDYHKGDIVDYKNTYYTAIQDTAATDTFILKDWKIINKEDVKTGLLPNFATNAAKFNDLYDVDSSTTSEQLQEFGAGLIGFRKRDYLTDLNLSVTSQIKFYQGFIKDKGTKNAINALKNSLFNNLKNDVTYYEEWGFRVGEYGAQNSNHTVEIQLDESWRYTGDLGLAIIDNDAEPINGIISIRDQNLYARPLQRGPVNFLNRTPNSSIENDIQSAGYAIIDDVDATIFDSSTFNTTITDLTVITSGFTIWVAKGNNRDWDIYRVNETNNIITDVEYALDLRGRVKTKNPHNFKVGDIVLIKQFNDLFNGFQEIVEVDTLTSFVTATTIAQNLLLKNSPISGSGILFVLNSIRFNSPKEIANATPLHTWKDGDLTWVDADEHGNWVVYEKSSPWQYATLLDMQTREHMAYSHYGTSVKISPDGKFIAVGSPGDYSGVGALHVFKNNTTKKEIAVLPLAKSNITALGSTVDASDRHIIVGAPNTNLDTGKVVVYSVIDPAYVRPVQIIDNPSGLPASKFGSSISVSQNGQYLYIGSPGVDRVFCYKLVDHTFNTTAFKAVIGKSYTLPYTVGAAESLAVYYKNELLTLGTDYTVSNNSVVVNSSVFNINEFDIFTEQEDGFIVITRRAYYQYLSVILGAETGVLFGHSVKTESTGKILVIGAPNSSVNGKLYAGAAYVYKNTNDSISLVEKIKPDVSTYRANFGTSVEVSNNDCNIYVGAPGYSYNEYSGGAVFRFVNTGLLHGSVVSMPIANNLLSGNIVVNNTLINFSGGLISNLASAINRANIKGITATSSQNTLTIKSALTTSFNKLEVLPYGNSLDYYGISVYKLTEKIVKPFKATGDKFGSKVRTSANAETLLISSINGSIELYANLDNAKTTFDGKITRFIDYFMGTGAVYTYDFMPSSIKDLDPNGRFSMAQEFGAANLRAGDLFGDSVDFNLNSLVIGATLHDNTLPAKQDAGQVYCYENATGKIGWNKIKHQLPAVDVNGINRIFLYDAKTKSMLTSLDYIDPAKGKVLGIAAQDLDFKSSYDPASYNSGTAVDQTRSNEYHWNAAQVGVTWWNLNTLRYIDYEQGDINYRLKNWGKLFPGSDVAVYEWVASNLLPSEYSSVEQGTPLYSDNSAYVTTYGLDINGVITSTYYYWVKGRSDVPRNGKRLLSATGIENVIANPKLQNIPYAEILSDRSIGLVNCEKYISGTNTILQVDYDSVLNTNVMHNEFELVQQGNGNSILPTRISDKLVDSLSGVDRLGMVVPDPKLRYSQQIGLGLRPRQTLVRNRNTALKNIVEYANLVFSGTTASTKIQSTHTYTLANWFAKDPEPPASEYDFRAENITELGYVNQFNEVGDIQVGLRVLVADDQDYYGLWTLRELTAAGEYAVVKNQQFNTTKLWGFDTWYSSEFTSGTTINYVVEQYSDIEKINIVAGDIVKVLNGPKKGFEIYKFSSATDSALIALEFGTLKINDLIWNTDINGVGFDNAVFDGSSFDNDYSQEIRNILIGLQKNILIEDLADDYNKLMFVAVEYILSEQKNIDWAFKTSFIDVLHQIRDLDQFPLYVKDNTSYYKQYLEEVKPYRTKIRNYRVGYTGMDVASAYTSDFDLPGYYDSDLKRFRSPSTEYFAKDNKLFLLPEYQDWYNNYLNSIASVTVTNRGQGYTEAPVITIVDSAGSGTGVVAYATIGEIAGTIDSITIVNPGKNFRGEPKVLISGVGTGATAVARLANNKVRSIKTTLKFDRVDYSTDITEWLPNTSYASGRRVSYGGQGYVATDAVPAGQLFNFALFDKIADTDYKSAVDRIASRYQPTKHQVPREFDPATGVINLSRIVPVADYRVNDNTEIYNDTSLASPMNYDDATGTNLTDINLSGGTFVEEKIARAPEELIPGTTLDTLVMTVITDISANIGAPGNVAYRMFKSIDENTEYYSVTGSNVSLLTSTLNRTDTTANVASVSLVFGGVTTGSVFINGEKIIYRDVDFENNRLLHLSRGVGGTPIPAAHSVDSRVESAGPDLAIPNRFDEYRTNYTFKKTNPSFTTGFMVADLLEVTKNQLSVYIDITKLRLDIDYTLLISNSRAVITFTADAVARIANGIKVVAKYREYAQWQDYNTTLGSSTTPIAVFLKSKPYY